MSTVAPMNRPTLVSGQRLDAETLFRLYKDTPGLWLVPKALLDNDSIHLIAALDRGLASPAHAAFVAALNDQRSKNANSPKT